MPECNIDARGKVARFVGGLAGVAFSLLLAVLLMTDVVAHDLGWFAVAGAFFGGAFAIFEARAGWCVIRAMGIKTRL